MCVPCQEQTDLRRQRTASAATAIGSLLGLAVALVLTLSEGGPGRELLFPAGLLGVSAGGIVGYLIGAALARRGDPVHLRRFSPSRGTVSIHFANTEYAEQVLDLMRKEERERR
jgi:hypothetical protein